MEYPIAALDEEAKSKVKNLEQELGVILIAYDKKDEGRTTESMYMDGNINLI